MICRDQAMPARSSSLRGVAGVALGARLATFAGTAVSHGAARANGASAAAGDGERHVARAVGDGGDHASRGALSDRSRTR